MIGYGGAAAFATGPHLHFELRTDGQPVNPLHLLPPSGEVKDYCAAEAAVYYPGGGTLDTAPPIPAGRAARGGAGRRGGARLISRRAAVLGGAALVTCTFLLAWALFGLGVGPQGSLRRGLGSTGERNLATGLALIRSQYYEQTDPQAVSQAALQGAVSALGDPYSAYLSPQAYQALQSATAGRYTGIGVEIARGGAGLPVVLRVFAGGSAATTAPEGGGKPGLRPGDEIEAIDGRPVSGVSTAVVQQWLVGANGSTVTLDVLRPAPSGGTTPLRFVCRRQPVQIQTVQWSMLPGSVGYLAIRMFNRRTPGDVVVALNAMKAKGMRAMVLDLRDDPGGLLASTVQVARYLLPGGVIAYLQPRDGPRRGLQIPAPVPLGVPYALLVNGYTASAAELLAGAVQDGHVAPVVGTRTFGKGSVQRVYPLAGGAALKLTVAHYLTPAGRDINGSGIVPDMVVPASGRGPAGFGDPATDPQLAAALALLAQRSAA